MLFFTKKLNEKSRECHNHSLQPTPKEEKKTRKQHMQGKNTNTWEAYGPRQANLVLIVYASSEGSGEPAHPCSLARTFTARSYKQWVERNRQTDPWPLWMAGHAQLKFVMTECSKTNWLDGAHIDKRCLAPNCVYDPNFGSRLLFSEATHSIFKTFEISTSSWMKRKSGLKWIILHSCLLWILPHCSPERSDRVC